MSSRSTTTPSSTRLRGLRPADWPEAAQIYAEGIATGVASFETEPPPWEEWDAAHSEIRLVAELDGRLAGWCALAPVSSRGCYRGVAEESVYVASWAQGRGVGRALLEEAIARSEEAGIWTLQAGIFPENKPSLRLHLGCEFRLVGVRERLGEAGGVWRDVLLLERRSGAAG
ncbi:MAG TPA: GNAT family N-acetyltransferase [Gaiellaceae bacterium]|nr:GNAT family N-acetyltransferase [Gaiellaceae bacterium]